MHDAIELEKRGVVTAAIVTELFKEPARHHARNFGMPTYPIIAIAHPIANLRPEDLKKRTEEIFPQVLAALTRLPED
ncbi:MAG: hypothetical protein FVQ06_08890 [candidate division NC10 bacterium]|nr:hypothetical protein [candidate division NC10 bacterium]